MEERGRLRPRVAVVLRACLKIAFGVPSLGGTAWEPTKGETPNLRLRIFVGFVRHALSKNWRTRASALLISRLNLPGRGRKGSTNFFAKTRRLRFAAAP